ncbi:MAG: hypothetical protein LBS83_00770 [Holosporales bacterium]|jgi:predicted DsbA family dithiol-disulfide isomerase|nr:hypothetical protein [Holosporales bacterium]
MLSFMNFRNALLCSIGAFVLVGCEKVENSNSSREEKIKKIAREVVSEILENEPERLLKAMEAGVQKQQQQATKKIEAMATESQQKFWSSKLVIGNKDAKLKLCIFFDPLEPVSQKFREDVMEQIAKERSDVGFFLIPVSIYSGGEADRPGPNSILAAQSIITACWQSPAKAIALWGKMPSLEKELSETILLGIAKEVGLDSEKLKVDIKSNTAHETLVANGQLAVQIGIPLQLPVIFIRKLDGGLEYIPPFIKEKMVLVLDAVNNDKPWEMALVDSVHKQPSVKRNPEPKEDGESAENERKLKQK